MAVEAVNMHVCVTPPLSAPPPSVCDHPPTCLCRADDALSTHTLDLSNRLAAAATEAQAAAAAAAYERHQRVRV